MSENDLRERLRAKARASTKPPDWVAEKEGDELLGTLVDEVVRSTLHGEARVLMLETDDGKRVGLPLYHAMLRRLVEDQGPQPGDVLYVEYLGERVGKNGNAFKTYSLAVERRTKLAAEEQVPHLGDEEWIGADEEPEGPSDSDEAERVEGAA